jgi:hypothetical protein
MEQYPSHLSIHYTIFHSLQARHLPKFILIICYVIVNGISKETIKGKGSGWCLKFGNGSIVLIWKLHLCFLEQYLLVFPIHATTFRSL